MNMKIVIYIVLLVVTGAASAYIYSQVDPRLEIIILKNEEIMRLDNKIAQLTEENLKLNEQMGSIASEVKKDESKSGRIHDEYRVCVRTTKKLKAENKELDNALVVERNKNRILRSYVQVKNEVTSLEEQIKALEGRKTELTNQLGDQASQDMGIEGGAVPVEDGHGHAGETVPDAAPQ